jgi:hypothetical protein
MPALQFVSPQGDISIFGGYYANAWFGQCNGALIVDFVDDSLRCEGDANYNVEMWERTKAAALDASDYVQRSLVWSNISKFMRLRISQFASAIPLIGYLLLWSDKFKEVFILQKALGTGLWLDTTTRLQFIYYGAISLALT